MEFVKRTTQLHACVLKPALYKKDISETQKAECCIVRATTSFLFCCSMFILGWKKSPDLVAKICTLMLCFLLPFPFFFPASNRFATVSMAGGKRTYFVNMVCRYIFALHILFFRPIKHDCTSKKKNLYIFKTREYTRHKKTVPYFILTVADGN